MSDDDRKTRIANLLLDAAYLFEQDGTLKVETCDAFLAMVTEVVGAWKVEIAQASLERPCCRFHNIDNLVYKGVYLPGVEEFVAHGYKRDLYESFLASWKQNIDEHGRP